MSWLAIVIAALVVLWVAERAFAWLWQRWTGERLSVGDWLRGLWR